MFFVCHPPLTCLLPSITYSRHQANQVVEHPSLYVSTRGICCSTCCSLLPVLQANQVIEHPSLHKSISGICCSLPPVLQANQVVESLSRPTAIVPQPNETLGVARWERTLKQIDEYMSNITSGSLVLHQ